MQKAILKCPSFAPGKAPVDFPGGRQSFRHRKTAETLVYGSLSTKGKEVMQRWTCSLLGLLVLTGIGLTAIPPVTAEPDPLLHVSVAFGRGLNTAQAGNPVNHVVIPDDIQVKQDGVVHFLNSGFHQLVVYKPGITDEDIRDFITDTPVTGTFINFLDEQFYLGINPAGGPLGTPGTTNPSNASNRVESVSFPAHEGRSPTTGALLSAKAEPGTYLVICNIRTHFLDGMYAYIKVRP